MKFRFFTMMLLMVGFTISTYATNPISPDAIGFEKTMKVEKINKGGKILGKLAQTRVGKWLLKKAVKVAQLVQKFAVDFQDPVEKWLWFAIFGAIAAILISILSVVVPFIWYISYLIWLAAVVSFWYWVYLKFLQ